MATDRKVAFVLTEYQYEAIEKLKQTKYYNKPYSDLLRYLVDEGLKNATTEKKER